MTTSSTDPPQETTTPLSTTITATVSAPGKILLAGGYLVLESPNVGLVVAVDKRFYTTVTFTKAPEATSRLSIVVQSLQFQETWSYVFDKASFQLTAIENNTSTPNAFVEKTLRVSLLYLMDSKNNTQTRFLSHLEVTIQADNEFYSLVPHLDDRQWDRSLASVQRLPRFLPAASVDGHVLKTGLGSSAALVTSLVGALCHALDEASVSYALAQITHCHAQGKIGSGFDVAAACYGSQLYQRFAAHPLEPLLEQLQDNNDDIQSLQTLLASSLRHPCWKSTTRPFPLPGLLQVLLADVSGGSESPSMARTVLKWKATCQMTPVPHWNDLAKLNPRVVELLEQLGTMSMSDAERQTLATSTAPQWSKMDSTVARVLSQLAEALSESRRHFKAMGQAAGVPMEPDEQTALANATAALPGVIGALVPGAGGYDALVCLYVANDTVRHAICDLWAQWTPVKVCPLDVMAGAEHDGLVVHDGLPPKPFSAKDE